MSLSSWQGEFDQGGTNLRSTVIWAPYGRFLCPNDLTSRHQVLLPAPVKQTAMTHLYIIKTRLTCINKTIINQTYTNNSKQSFEKKIKRENTINKKIS